MTTSTALAGRMTICNVADVTERPIRGLEGHEKEHRDTTSLAGWAVDGSPDLPASVLRMAPRQFRPAHLQPGIGELYFVLEGDCEISAGDTVTRITSGTALYTPRGTAHSLRTFECGFKALIVFPPRSLPLWLRVSGRYRSEP
jgi:mannose-6-phosphate isomerase-like protein (cupin superfamily)